MEKKFKKYLQNIKNDLDNCSAEEINLIYDRIYECLNKFDNDSSIKNLLDNFVLFFSFSKKNKILRMLNDLADSFKKLSHSTKDSLLNELKQIQDIHRSIWENFLILLGSL